MKKFRKSIAVILTILMLASAVPMSGFAVEDTDLEPGTECTHDYELVEAQEATCEGNGNIAYFKCSKCDKYFQYNEEDEETPGDEITDKDEVVIKTDGHDFSKKDKDNKYLAIPGKCSTKAIYYVSCSKCGISSKGFEEEDTFSGDKDLTKHEGETIVDEETVKEATCQNKGYTGDKICSVCKTVVKNGTETDFAPHVFTKETVDEKYFKSEADCLSPAIYYKSCEVCGLSSEGTDDEATFESGEKDMTKHQSEDKWETTYEYNDDVLKCRGGGKAITKCLCGEIKAEESFTNHNRIYIDEKEPTCTEPGNETYAVCSRCGELLVGDPTPIDAKGHSPEDVEAVEPTCTEPGNTAGKRCTVCGETIEGLETVDAKGHKEEISKKVPATCTDKGRERGSVCTVCGVITDGCEELPALGHDRVQHEAVQATCTEDGTIEYYTCRNEGCDLIWKLAADEDVDPEDEESKYIEITEEETIVPKGHVWDVENADYTIEGGKEPTCTEAGKGKVGCKNCDVVEERETPVLDHDWEETRTVESTCVDDGYFEYTCSRCNATKTEVNTEDPGKGGHVWQKDENGEYVYTVDVKASCKQQGEQSIHCTVCAENNLYEEYGSVAAAAKCKGGRMNTTVMPKTDHETLIKGMTPADCTTDGREYEYCPVCHYEKDLKVIPALGHDYKAISGSPADCDNDSTQELECSRCKDTKKDETKKLNHVDKNQDGKCDNCNKTMCDCLCHKTGTFNTILYRFVLFFWDLLHVRQTCDCGRVHYKITHM